MNDPGTQTFSDVDALQRIVLAVQSVPDDLDMETQRKRDELATKVNENYALGVGYRREWMYDREQSIRYFEHHQWPDISSATKKIMITINRVKPSIETVMGMISRTKMMVALSGVGPEDAIKGAVMNTLFEETCRKDGAEFIHHQALQESRKTGLGVVKETWDWRMDFPYGMPRLEFLKSSEIIIQPGAFGLQYEDAAWIIHEKVYDTDALKAMYPDLVDDIKPDDEWLKAIDAKPYWHTAHARRDLWQARSGSNSGPSMPSTSQQNLNTTTLKEMWYKEWKRIVKRFALKDFDQLGIKAGREVPDEQAMLLQKDTDYAEIPFADYQMRVAKVFNNHLLSDIPTPYGHDKFPFTFYKANPLDQYTYPASDIKYMVELQDMLNKMYSLMADYAIRTSNSPIFGDEDLSDAMTMKNLMNYWNFPGMYVPMRRGRKPPTILQLPTLSESLLIIARQLSASLDELIGVRGDRVFAEPPQASGKALGEMRMNADIFHAPKSNPVQHALFCWAEMRIANVQHLMKQDHMVRIDNRLAQTIGDTPHNVFMQQDQLGGQHYRINRPGMDEQGQELNLNDMSVGKFDIKVSLVGDYAETKRDTAEMGIGLKKMEAIDDEALLEAVDWPNREEVLKRKDEKNSLLQLGKQVAEDPILMAISQKPELRAQIEAMLNTRLAPGNGKAAPVEGAMPMMPQGEPNESQ